MPDSPGFHLTYPGKGTLIHSRGFQRSRAYWAMYDHHVEEAAALHQVSPDLVRSVMAVESEFDQWAVSSKGARGLMQLMPATARRSGVADSFDARQNIFGGTQYLRILLDQFGGDVTLALAAYNAGPNAVLRYGGIPPYRETRGYVQKVQAQLGTGFAAPAPSSNAAAFYVPSTTAAPRQPVRSGRPRGPARWSRRGPAPTTAGATSAASPTSPRRPPRRGRCTRRFALSTSHARPHPPRPVRPGAVPRPLQQGAGALRGPAPRRSRAAARGGLPPAAPRPAGAQPARPRLLPRGEARQGRGGLPQAHRGEPRGPHPALQPGPHLLQAGPPRGRRVGLPQGARPDAGQPEDPLLPRVDLRAAPPLQGRDLPVPAGRREPDGPAAAGPDGPGRSRRGLDRPPRRLRPAPAAERAAGGAARHEAAGARSEAAGLAGSPRPRRCGRSARPSWPRTGPSRVCPRRLASRRPTTPSPREPGGRRCRAPRPPPCDAAGPGAVRPGGGPRGLPRPREGPDGGGLLGQGLHQAGHDLLVQRQPDLLGEGQARRRAPGARDRHRDRAAAS